MYYPYINIFGNEVPTWLIFGGMNMVLGKCLLLYLGYKRGIEFSNWFFLIFFATLGAAVGAVVLPSIIGVLSGFIGCLFLGKRIIGINEETGDLIAVYIAVVFSIGRLGCLFNGCCFGTPVNIFPGISYPYGTLPHWLHQTSGLISNISMSSLPVHPVQFYESLFLIFCAITIIRYSPKMRSKNALLPFFFGCCLLFRFGIEFFRGTSNVWWSLLSFGSFSYFQWILLICGALMFLVSFRMNRNFKPKVILPVTHPKLLVQFAILIATYFLIMKLSPHLQLIHLFQLIILSWVGGFLLFSHILKHYFFKPISSICQAMFISGILLSPLISREL